MTMSPMIEMEIISSTSVKPPRFLVLFRVKMDNPLLRPIDRKADFARSMPRKIRVPFAVRRRKIWRGKEIWDKLPTPQLPKHFHHITCTEGMLLAYDSSPMKILEFFGAKRTGSQAAKSSRVEKAAGVLRIGDEEYAIRPLGPYVR
jgi:hypothetical protein